MSPTPSAERMIRQPRGYRSSNHETIGTDLLALLDAVLMPEQILGHERVAALRSIRPTGWYPIAEMIEPLEQLARKLTPDSLRKVGQNIFRNSHEAQFRRAIFSARACFQGLDRIYHAANRGADIGGWRVVSFEKGNAVLEKTTPHHCVMEEGIIEAALRTLNVPVVIRQSTCFRNGAEACRFVVTSHITDARWGALE